MLLESQIFEENESDEKVLDVVNVENFLSLLENLRQAYRSLNGNDRQWREITALSRTFQKTLRDLTRENRREK